MVRLLFNSKLALLGLLWTVSYLTGGVNTMSDLLDIIELGGMVVEAGLLGQVELQHQRRRAAAWL